MPPPRRFALVTLGCARNEVDSEELAGRLTTDGWALASDPEGSDADVVLVNTCAFVEAAKRDSIDAVLAVTSAAQSAGEAGEGRRKVVLTGCLAERYGDELADLLPETDAVLGFDDYPDIAERLAGVLAGERPPAHAPRDRRTLLPITPVERPAALAAPRVRLDTGPTASVRLASGCDRRCAFCAIPSFRGSFVSRPAAEILDEARWLATVGVREIVLVSENSTSYGKDLGDIRALEALLPALADVSGIDRIRVAYLQPAEMRTSLVETMTGTPGVLPYFDLSFQHASASVLRRMRRFGSGEHFLDLVADIRRRAPQAGLRSNVIVGFPGESGADLAELEHFLIESRLDAVGVFGYSAEEGTEAAAFPDSFPKAEIRARVERIASLVDELMAQRAEDRIGQGVEVLVESLAADTVEGRAVHQGPDSDGTTMLVGPADGLAVGDIVTAMVVGSDGADLIADPGARR